MLEQTKLLSTKDITETFIFVLLNLARDRKMSTQDTPLVPQSSI